MDTVREADRTTSFWGWSSDKPSVPLAPQESSAAQNGSDSPENEISSAPGRLATR